MHIGYSDLRSTAHSYLLLVRWRGRVWDRTRELGPVRSIDASFALPVHQHPSVWCHRIRVMIVSSPGALVLGHLSLLPLCLTKGPPTMLVSTLVVGLFQAPRGHLGRLVTDCCAPKSNLPGLSPHVSRFLFSLYTRATTWLSARIHWSLHSHTRHIRIMPAREIDRVL